MQRFTRLEIFPSSPWSCTTGVWLPAAKSQSCIQAPAQGHCWHSPCARRKGRVRWGSGLRSLGLSLGQPGDSRSPARQPSPIAPSHVVMWLLSRPTVSDGNGGFELHKPCRCPRAAWGAGWTPAPDGSWRAQGCSARHPSACLWSKAGWGDGDCGWKTVSPSFSLLSFPLLQPSPRLPINNTHIPCSVTKTARSRKIKRDREKLLLQIQKPVF